MNLPTNKKLALRDKIILINLFFLGGAAAVIFFIVLPSLEDIRRIKGEIEAQFIDLEEKYQRTQNLRKLNSGLKKIEPQIENLDKIFVQKNKEVEFISSLEELAHQHLLTQKISLGAIKKGATLYSQTPLQISTQGSFSNQLKYIEGLKDMDYQVNIRSIELSGGGGDAEGSQSTINMNLAVDTYWR